MDGASDGKNRIIEALRKLDGKPHIKKIAETAKMSPQTASKYLMALESEKRVKRDDSQLPYICWELKEG